MIGVEDKKFYYYGGSLKNMYLRERGFTKKKKKKLRRTALKGAWAVARFKRGA